MSVRAFGVATGPRTSADELLRDADIALHKAKQAGKGCFGSRRAPQPEGPLRHGDPQPKLTAGGTEPSAVAARQTASQPAS